MSHKISSKICGTPCQIPKGEVSNVTILLPNNIILNSTVGYEFVFGSGTVSIA